MRQCQTMNPPLVHIICSFLIMHYSMSGMDIIRIPGCSQLQRVEYMCLCGPFDYTISRLCSIVVNGIDYTSIYNRAFDHDGTLHTIGADESVTGYAVARVNQGDDVFLRTHSAYKGKEGIFSNGFGLSTFGGWILFQRVFFD